jgi:hypothetical protein
MEFKTAFWLPTTTTDSHVLALVIIGLPVDRYTKFKFFFIVLVMKSYKYSPAAYVTMHCMILL